MTKQSFSLRTQSARLEVDPLSGDLLNFSIDDGLETTQIPVSRVGAEELVKYLQLWLASSPERTSRDEG